MKGKAKGNSFEAKADYSVQDYSLVVLQYSNVGENDHQGTLEGLIQAHSQSDAWKDFELECLSNENAFV